MVVGLLGLGGGVAVAEPKAAPRRVPSAAHKRPVAKAPARVAPRTAEAAPAPAPPPSTTTVLVQYQRIGRDLRQLQELRGTECTLELWPRFRAIKLDEATATAEARTQTAATLDELQLKIERKRGIILRQECLDNPLAAECQL
jgi:hypothetical protein